MAKVEHTPQDAASAGDTKTDCVSVHTLRLVLFGIGGLLILTTIILWIVAIWTVGDNSGRIAGTGVVVLFVGAAVLAVTGCFVIEPEQNPERRSYDSYYL